MTGVFVLLDITGMGSYSLQITLFAVLACLSIWSSGRFWRHRVFFLNHLAAMLIGLAFFCAFIQYFCVCCRASPGYIRMVRRHSWPRRCSALDPLCSESGILSRDPSPDTFPRPRFTSIAFTQILKDAEIAISMDGSIAAIGENVVQPGERMTDGLKQSRGAVAVLDISAMDGQARGLC